MSCELSAAVSLGVFLSLPDVLTTKASVANKAIAITAWGLRWRNIHIARLIGGIADSKHPKEPGQKNSRSVRNLMMFSLRMRFRMRAGANRAMQQISTCAALGGDDSLQHGDRY